MQLINGEKDWNHVSVQKVITFNICCDVACLTFQLSYITTGSFQVHQCQPTIGSFHSHQRFEQRNITLSQMKKFCILQGSVVTFSGVVGIMYYILTLFMVALCNRADHYIFAL